MMLASLCCVMVATNVATLKESLDGLSTPAFKLQCSSELANTRIAMFGGGSMDQKQAWLAHALSATWKEVKGGQTLARDKEVLNILAKREVERTEARIQSALDSMEDAGLLARGDAATRIWASYREFAKQVKSGAVTPDNHGHVAADFVNPVGLELRAILKLLGSQALSKCPLGVWRLYTDRQGLPGQPLPAGTDKVVRQTRKTEEALRDLVGSSFAQIDRAVEPYAYQYFHGLASSLQITSTTLMVNRHRDSLTARLVRSRGQLQEPDDITETFQIPDLDDHSQSVSTINGKLPSDAPVTWNQSTRARYKFLGPSEGPQALTNWPALPASYATRDVLAALGTALSLSVCAEVPDAAELFLSDELSHGSLSKPPTLKACVEHLFGPNGPLNAEFADGALIVSPRDPLETEICDADPKAVSEYIRSVEKAQLQLPQQDFALYHKLTWAQASTSIVHWLTELGQAEGYRPFRRTYGKAVATLCAKDIVSPDARKEYATWSYVDLSADEKACIDVLAITYPLSKRSGLAVTPVVDGLATLGAEYLAGRGPTTVAISQNPTLGYCKFVGGAAKASFKPYEAAQHFVDISNSLAPGTASSSDPKNWLFIPGVINGLILSINVGEEYEIDCDVPGDFQETDDRPLTFEEMLKR